jgi:EAL domain-containing protein (putative c-di-GMP-specific phosphodiesterase class I)
LKIFRKTQTTAMTVFRIGSDEFAIGLRHCNYNKTTQIAKNLNLFLEKQIIQINNNDFDISVTIVYSDAPEPLKKALVALSIAKEKHISICCYKDIKNESKDKEYFEMRKLIKTAIEKNQITPYAQAIVNNEGKTIKYELLMRIVTEDKVIPPYFLDYAKKAKLYNKLSQQMLKKCFKFIEKTDVLCSINIDLEDIKNEETVKKLESYIDKVKKPVVFEILEYDSMSDYILFKEFVDKFRNKGVLFAIDDFGSGFSNYKEIISLKPDYLKIDGSLIKNILEDNENLLLVYSIISLTSMLDIKTTAEFVENKEIFEKLKSIGIDESQGYYFAKPTPLNELK